MNFKIKCHIYPYTVHVFYEQRVDTAKAMYQEYYKCELNAEITDFDALTVYPVRTQKHFSKIVILLGKENGDLLGNIHHESIHATIYILDKSGIEISYQNDESITYLSTYLFEKIINKLKLNIQS